MLKTNQISHLRKSDALSPSHCRSYQRCQQMAQKLAVSATTLLIVLVLWLLAKVYPYPGSQWHFISLLIHISANLNTSSNKFGNVVCEGDKNKTVFLMNIRDIETLVKFWASLFLAWLPIYFASKM